MYKDSTGSPFASGCCRKYLYYCTYYKVLHGLDISMGVLGFFGNTQSFEGQGWLSFLRLFGGALLRYEVCRLCGPWGCGMNKACHLSQLSLRRQKPNAIIWSVILVETWGRSYLYSKALHTINSNIFSRFKGAFTSAVFDSPGFFYFYLLLRFAQLVYENCLKQILSKGQQLQGSSRGALISPKAYGQK